MLLLQLRKRVPSQLQVAVEVNHSCYTIGSRAPAKDVRFPIEQANTRNELDDGEVSGAAEHVSFFGRVIFESTEFVGKTSQVLRKPDVSIASITSTSACVRLSNLSGDKFVLTVYSTGTSDKNSGSDSDDAGLVQEGLVRTAEYNHHVEKLKSSKVYVVWVKVICEDKSLESESKGFKTLPVKEKTIWDDPDHVVLGISPDATAREITKAWRLKSLQCHPDKEIDPEKKEAAEEIMKRLNIAKINMLKCATTQPDAFEDAPREQPDRSHGPEENGVYSSEARECADYENPDPAWTEFPVTPVTSDPVSETDNGDTFACSLLIDCPKQPTLIVVGRALHHLRLQASNLPVGMTLQVLVLNGDNSESEAVLATRIIARTMEFNISDLEENTNYRFRVRLSLEIEPLRVLWAKFVGDPVE